MAVDVFRNLLRHELVNRKVAGNPIPNFLSMRYCFQLITSSEITFIPSYSGSLGYPYLGKNENGIACNSFGSPTTSEMLAADPSQ